MEEQDLKNIWHKTDKQAGEYYEGIAPEILKKAKKSSHDILARVRKNILIELWASAIATVAFPFLFLQNWVLLVSGTVLIVVAMLATLKVYMGYLKKIREINDDDLITGLTKKVEVLGGWIRRVKILVYVFSIISFYFGMFIGASESGFELKEDISLMPTLIQVTISLPFLLLFFWGLNKYLYLLYGRNLKKLKAILNGLTESEND